MHKEAWSTPVVHYALRGDHYEAYKVSEQFLVRAMPDSLGASRVRELASCNAEFKRKLLACAFMALENSEADINHSICAEDDRIYVNLCTHLTCYGEHGKLIHTERVHCTTVCLPRTFDRQNAQNTEHKLQMHWAKSIDHACESARILVKHNDSFHYLHASDFSILKTI